MCVLVHTERGESLPKRVPWDLDTLRKTGSVVKYIWETWHILARVTLAVYIISTSRALRSQWAPGGVYRSASQIHLTIWSFFFTCHLLTTRIFSHIPLETNLTLQHLWSSNILDLLTILLLQGTMLGRASVRSPFPACAEPPLSPSSWIHPLFEPHLKSSYSHVFLDISPQGKETTSSEPLSYIDFWVQPRRTESLSMWFRPVLSCFKVSGDSNAARLHRITGQHLMWMKDGWMDGWIDEWLYTYWVLPVKPFEVLSWGPY